MDADTSAHTRSWQQLLPLLIFLIGGLITFLLWQDTREVLATESDQSLSYLHDAQAHQLQVAINEQENSLNYLAAALGTTALEPQAALQALGLPMLERQGAWRHLTLARTGPDYDQLEVLTSIPEAGTPWQPGHDLSLEPLWQPLLTPSAQQPGIRTTPRFTPDGGDAREIQALSRPLRLDDGENYLLIAAFEPDILIEQALTLSEPIPMRTSVIDLDQHENEPLFVTRDVSAEGPVQETRIELGDRGWLVRSQGLTDLFDGSGSQLLNAILAGGLALSLTVALLFWQLNRQRLLTIQRAQQLHQRWDRDLKALENKKLEKDVLSRALSDSEQRSRDFIQLGAGIGFELDDEQAIGYVSRQIQSLLGHAPADLAGKPMADLFPASEHKRLADALTACRQQLEPVQIDASLAHGDGRELAFRIRFCTITDALSHCQGYRAIAWPRQSTD